MAVNISKSEKLTHSKVKISIGGKPQASKTLANVLHQLKKETGLNNPDLLVMSPSRDPLNIGTKTWVANGNWFRTQMDAAGLLDGSKPIHLRGIHYTILSLGGVLLPSGEKYVNDFKCWKFMCDNGAKAARWLGLVPWEKIVDERNEAPACIEYSKESLSLSVSVSVVLPGIDKFKPSINVEGEPKIWQRSRTQKFHLVFWGEKTSLREVLKPLAYKYRADLYLPSGNVSDTMLYKMAKDGAADGRPMIVFVFADCDPSGYGMATEIAHKLRCHQLLDTPTLDFTVHAPCLTVEQVKALNLPSTPLKKGDKRAKAWKEAFGIDQTEIDALATLQPDVLEKIVREAVDPYFDADLDERVAEAKDEWVKAAQDALDKHESAQELAELRDVVEEQLEWLQETLDQINGIVEDIDIDLPEFEVPDPILEGEPAKPLVSSDMEMIDHIQTLQARKQYAMEDEED